MLTIFKQTFWQPPRAHGDVIEDRLLSLAIVAVLSAVWAVAVDRWLRLPDPSDARPQRSEPAG